MAGYTIKERLETFIGNCEVQQGFAMWDDIEKLESILELMKRGKNINDEFEFVDTGKEAEGGRV